METCCICGKEFERCANDPFPIKQTGMCCNVCYSEVVLPAKLDRLLKGVEDGYKSGETI